MITIIAERLTHVESVKKLTAWRLKSVSGIQSRRTRIFHGHGATVWTKVNEYPISIRVFKGTLKRIRLKIN